MAFALDVVAGVIAGLSLDIFALFALVSLLFAATLLVGLKGGVLAAICTAAAASGVLQVGYVAGLLARRFRPAPRNYEVAPSSEPVEH